MMDETSLNRSKSQNHTIWVIIFFEELEGSLANIHEHAFAWNEERQDDMREEKL